MQKKILIVGSTGLVGGHLLRIASQKKDIDKIYTLVRRPQELKSEKIEEICFDFDDNKAYDRLPEVDDVYCCLGTTIKKAGSKENFKKVDYHYPLKIATHYRNIAQSFNVITALGADSRSFIFYNQVKGELEDALKTLNFDTLNIFQPSLLIGERDEFRLGESVASAIMPKLDFLLIKNLKKYRSIQGKDVAKGMLNAIKTNNKTKTYTSDEIQAMANAYNATK